MRMGTLHVHDAFIFRGFEFRQVSVYCRRLTSVHVHVEKRSIKHREKKRRYCAAGSQSSHGCILMNWWFEVNPNISEEFLKFLSKFGLAGG